MCISNLYIVNDAIDKISPEMIYSYANGLYKRIEKIMTIARNRYIISYKLHKHSLFSIYM